MKLKQLLIPVGGGLLFLAAVNLLGPQGETVVNASYPPAPAANSETNYLSWFEAISGSIFLSFGLYLKWQEKRRADRAEAREVHDRRQRGDDIR